MSKVVIIGAGTHSANVYELLQEYTTKNIEIAKKSLEEMQDVTRINNDDWYIIAIGDNSQRDQVFNHFSARGYAFPEVNLNLPNPINYDISNGNVIMRGAYISRSAELGKNNLFNTGSIIEHHVQINNSCHIGPGAVVCGSVIIGSQVLVGANATIVPKKIIGDGKSIKAGSVLTENLL